MTKYILNSGNAKNFPEKDKAYIEEILKGCGKEVRVLYCFFAQSRERWEARYAEYSQKFQEIAGEKIKLRFELALPEKFEEQVAKSDVIMIQGGDDHLLQFWLKKFDLPKIWEGKVVAASSAGSDALVNSYWTCDWRECQEGLNILPIKFIPHFNSKNYGKGDPRGPIDWEKAQKDLAEFGDKNLPIYALEKGNFVVFEK
jgi:peptidase E